MSRVFKTRENQITQIYKKGIHNGIDLCGRMWALDYIVAHSDGKVVGIVKNCNVNTSKTGQTIYGNYVMLKHDNGMYTLYAHLKYGSVTVNLGDRVSKGQVIGYMGNTGYSFGAHLHFEVRDKNNNRIDPTPYINADLPSDKPKNKYIVGKIYTLKYALKVRAGAGTDKAWKLTSQLTADGKKHAYNQKYAVLKPGTQVSCLETKNLGDEIWMRIPSGWIAAYYDNEEYVK